MYVTIDRQKFHLNNKTLRSIINYRSIMPISVIKLHNLYKDKKTDVEEDKHGCAHPKSPPDVCAIHPCSGTAAELICFNSSQCVCAATDCGCGVFLLRCSFGNLEPPAADMQGFYFCRMMKHNAAAQSRLSRTGSQTQIQH